MSVALVLSAKSDDELPLPAVALNSSILLDLERAVLVGAMVAATFVFLTRGWAGHFPSKLSTTGAEYPSPVVLAEFNKSDADTTSSARELRARQAALTDGFQIVAQRLVRLESELRQTSNRDDTL